MEKPRPDTVPEADWIKRAQQGDREAFGHLVERHQRRVFSLVFHTLRRKDEVEDIAQEVFLKAFLAIRSYNFQSSFGTWLARVTMNHCFDYLRRVRASRVKYYWQMGDEARRQIEARAESLGSSAPTAERQMALRELAGKLLDRAPADDRIILSLKELEELSVEEIAEIMDLKVSTVKVRLHRARKRMLQDLKRWR